MLVVFEGIDFTGKSSIIDKLSINLTSKYNIPIYKTREPGGSVISEKIREIILNYDMDKVTRLLLFEASRREMLVNLKYKIDKELVLMDRFVFSTICYQGNGEDINIDFIDKIHEIILDNLFPDLVFILKINKETFLKRSAKVKADVIESKGWAFFEKVQNCFLNIPNKYPKYKDRFIIIDNSIDNLDYLNNIVEDISQIILKKYKLEA